MSDMQAMRKLVADYKGDLANVKRRKVNDAFNNSKARAKASKAVMEQTERMWNLSA